MNSARKPPSEREIAELAAQQHGVVATWQLGLDKNAIEYRARIGRLHRIHRGVYAVGHRKLARTPARRPGQIGKSQSPRPPTPRPNRSTPAFTG